MTTVLDEQPGNEALGSAQIEVTSTDKPKSSEREYVVLEQRSQGWVEIKRITAGSQDAALRSLGTDLKQNLKYVAVPERNWRPAQPKVETRTTISLSFDD